MVSSVDKFDVEQLLNDFRIKNKDALQVYLKELWKDLSQRSEDKSKGVNRITFSKYYDLPGIILDRLFNVFDEDKNEYLDVNEFVDGITVLCTDGFDKLIKFIFKFYDFDRDNFITYEDVRVVLSYIPLNTQKKIRGSKFANADYKDRIESQDELKIILDKCFEKQKKLDFTGFQNIVENQNSEICLYILIFLLEKKPFSNNSLNPYEGVAKNKSPEVNLSKMIASPSLNSKFSPSLTIQKSPSMARKNLMEMKNKNPLSGNNVLNQLTGKSPLNKGGDESKSKLMMYAKGIGQKENTGTTTESKNPVRKQRENLKNIEELGEKKKDGKVIISSNEKEDETHLMGASKYHNQILDMKDDDDDISEEITYEGYLYKITQTKKLKKLNFKLLNKDLYCK